MAYMTRQPKLTPSAKWLPEKTFITYKSTKTWTHAQGLSCAFRQWRAIHSHCRFIHGYALQVEIVFQADTLDERNWVQDFGGLKDLKAWVVEQFDHKLLVAEDDPDLGLFRAMSHSGLCDLNIVPAVGCEKFAEMIFRNAEGVVQNAQIPNEQRVRVVSVRVSEHEGNSAIVEAVSR
jgi:6-pyruvoyltetrahydropterin/6-carboxytetrahydropterin synthase